MAARFAHVLFAVLSVHFVLVAMWLLVAGHAQAPLFGQWEEISRVKLVVWTALLSYCGMSGLLALTLKSERAVRQALVCWVLLSVYHTWYIAVVLSRSMWSSSAEDGGRHSWTTCEMVVQLLTDAMSSSFLAWHLRHNVHGDIVKEHFLREPLLPISSGRDECAQVVVITSHNRIY